MSNERQKVNIYELAKETGFSVSTVSKAINDTGRISKATKAIILNKASELNYVGSYHAKALSSNKSWIIAVIHTDNLGIGITHPHFSVILEHFKQEIEENGYEITFVNRNMAKGSMTYLEFCRYRNVEGVFVANYYGLSRQLPELINSGIPVVSAEIGDEGIISVTSDDYQGGILAAKYLHELGHKNLVYHISGPLDNVSARDRQSGFLDYYKKHDGTNLRTFESPNFGFEDGYITMNNILNEETIPSAVFTCGDLVALGAIKAIKEHGLKVPDDISIIGYDDLSFLKYNNPALTTIAQNKSQIGITAAHKLIAKISGKEVDSVTIPVEVIERETCKRVT